MSLAPLRGHAGARRALGRAAQRGRLGQSILLHGPAGIGKERLGLWLGQLILCEHFPTRDEPCGRCDACRRAERLEHPDLHWFFPLPRPESASSPARLKEKLEEQRAAELQARRSDPTYVPAPERPPAHFLAAVQTLQEMAVLRPVLGRNKVFVVGDAEAMVPQESSPEAANAFLKLLEEPLADTTLILTSAEPDLLLATIRSRVLPLRLLPLGAGEVRDFLVEHAHLPAPVADTLAERSGGSLGTALRLLPVSGDAAGEEPHAAHAANCLAAALADSAVERFALAHGTAPASARGEFLHQLNALTELLRDWFAVASGAVERVPRHRRDKLKSLLSRHEVGPVSVGRALERVIAARELAQGNVNPQLILADLLQGMNRALRGEGRSA